MNLYIQTQCFIFISLLLIITRPTTGADWNYHDLGPDVWSDRYPSCNGRAQSPINIQTACTKYQTFKPFSFTSVYNLTHDFTLVNNGHTIVGTYNGKNSPSLELTGGGLHETYYFQSFHLHWGRNYKSGSEHQVNGVKYAGEIHFVYRNPKTDEFAVLGIFMQSNRNESTDTQNSSNNLGKTENRTIEEWKRYFAAAENLQQINDSTILRLNLASLMGSNVDDFWRYEGSLTTPPCTQGVIWTVFTTPTIFSESELDAFRQNIYFEDYRSPQPLYNRIVYRNFLNETMSSIPDYSCCSNGSNSLTNKLFLLIPIEFILFICLFSMINI